MVDAVSRRYEIVCRLNGGGMADLYLARTLGPGGFERLVVIKRLAKRLASQPSAVQDMFDEARIAATLQHANIVQVNDIEIADGQVSIVMEFLHGHDVSHLLRRLKRENEQLPLDQAVAIVLAVCAGLHHAHERVDSEGKSLDIVHRDVSPHNVFVTYDGAVKLVDFGIARASVRKGHTEHGFIKGKPGYIAPEAIKGKKPDRRTDVWGAAVLLYELTTGLLPYGASTAFDDLLRVTKQDPPRPSQLVPGYPRELEAIVMKGLARDPALRYPTAEAMQIALEDFARSRSCDLSPFRMAALMERVFAENIEAWRQSQRLGRSLAEHVAAFKTSGAHNLVDLPGDPTEPFQTVGKDAGTSTSTTSLATGDLAAPPPPPTPAPITAPTKLMRPSVVFGDATQVVEKSQFVAMTPPPVPVAVPPVPSLAQAIAPLAPVSPIATSLPSTPMLSPRPPVIAPVEAIEHAQGTARIELEPTVPHSKVIEADVNRPTPMAFESLSAVEVAAFRHGPAVRKPVSRLLAPLGVILAIPTVVLISLLAWGSLDANHRPEPAAASPAPTENTRATAVDDQPVAHPITVEPIEPAPAPAVPAAAESSIETGSAVAHANPPSAKKKPSAKSSSRKSARSVQPPRATPAPRKPQPAEDDLDALLTY